jgi:hypothetical protein
VDADDFILWMVFINAEGLQVYAVKVSLGSKCYPKYWKLCTLVDCQ